MHFQLQALAARDFEHLFGRSDAELAKLGAQSMSVDATPGYPCRIGLRDPALGSRMILLSHEYQPANTPYRGRHAIFIEDGAATRITDVDEVPAYLGSRLLSVRAFGADHFMRDADVCAGTDAAAMFRHLLALPAVAYLQVHTARQGCYLAAVTPA